MSVASVFKSSAFLFAIVLVGGLAIAWKPQAQVVTRTIGINPSELRVDTHLLPAQEMNDMTFIFTNEH